MDPIGLLDALVAVAVYPGGIFLFIAAVTHRWAAGRGPAWTSGPMRNRRAAPLIVVAATVAVAMLPLTGSPALRLPPVGGVAGNVVAVGVLFAVAVDLGAGSVRVAALAAAAAVPVLGLAAAAGTLSVTVVAVAPGGAGLAARVVAAALLVVAGAVAGADWTGSVVAAGLALAAAALVVPAAVGDVAPPVAALACLAVAGAGGAVSRTSARWSTRLLTIVGAVAAGGGTVVALLSGRA